MTQNLLIVDDDPGLRDLLQRYLSEQGYIVATVGDGIALDQYLEENTTDLIILDLMLPGEDGLSIAKRLRKTMNTPIIILSARGDEVDRIVGLEIGADDYLAKPFNPRELLARIRAVMRRQVNYLSDEQQATTQDIHRFGPYQLDFTNRSLSREDHNIPLTSAEYDLLKMMLEHPNRVLSRDMLIDQLKGYDRSPFDRSIDVRITRLRRKLEKEPKSPEYIRTIWGAGYMFTPKGSMPGAKPRSKPGPDS